MENFNKNNELYGSLIRYDAPIFGPGYAFNAEGDTRYVATKSGPSFRSRPVIIRETGVIGTKIEPGFTFSGKRTPAQVAVINNDGSDYASYYFIIGQVGGREAWINSADVQDIGGGQYRVSGSGTYPMKPEWWIDEAHKDTLVPENYAFMGAPVGYKTIKAGEGYGAPEFKAYIRANVGGKEVFVPAENVTEGSRKIGTEETFTMSGRPVNTSTEATVDIPRVTLSPIKILLGVGVIIGAGFGLYKLLK